MISKYMAEINNETVSNLMVMQMTNDDIVWLMTGVVFWAWKRAKVPGDKRQEGAREVR